MYEVALTIHSILRAALVLLLLVGLLRALAGWFGHGTYASGHRSLGFLTLLTADVQLVLGILLYVVWSPQTKNALADFGAAMKDPELRRWAVEHPTMMVAALVLIHAANAVAKRAKEDAAKFRWTAITYSVALLLTVVGTNWPWSKLARPLVRFFD